MMSKRKKYLIVYSCNNDIGFGIGTAFIKRNHKIKKQKDVIEIQDCIEKNTDCKNVNIINWKELDDE